MKRKQILCAALIAAMAAVSCSRDEVTDASIPGDGDAIGFNTYVPASTRGVALSSASDLVDSKQGFDVFAFDGRDQNNAQVMGTAGDGVEITYNDGWTYKVAGEKVYWSQVGGANAILNFHAVSPASHASLTKDITASSQTLTYEVPTEPTDQTDLMSASKLGATKADGNVKFNFRHLLSQVVFKARICSTDYRVEIKEITLKNLKKKGKFTYGDASANNNITPKPAGTWVLEEERADYALNLLYPTSDDGGDAPTHVSVNSTTAVELTNASRALLALPHADGDMEKWATGTPTTTADGANQSYLAIKCRIYDVVNKNYLFSTATEDESNLDHDYETLYVPFDGTWEMGKKYTYTLVFLDPKGSNGFDEDGEPIDLEKAVVGWGEPETDDWEDGGEEELMNNTMGNSKNIKTVMIAAAGQSFMMGSPETEAGRENNETQHQVSFTKNFYMSQYEITNAQYCEFLNDQNIPSTGKYTFASFGEQTLIFDCQTRNRGNYPYGVTYNMTDSKWEPMSGYDNYPVIFVTWYGAYAYAEWAGGSLPTEAQWEYACRAGSTTAYCFGDDESDFDDYAWYSENSGVCTHPVGLNLPNAWGLYDMHGNVEEWCLDWSSDYGSDSVTDPTGPASGLTRIHRGGSYSSYYAHSCRSAYRDATSPANDGETYEYFTLGFRVVFSL